MQLAGLLDRVVAQRERRAAHARAEVGADRSRARDRARVDQGADPRGLPQPRRVSRRPDRGARGVAAALRQGRRRGSMRASRRFWWRCCARPARGRRSLRSAHARSPPSRRPTSPAKPIRARTHLALSGGYRMVVRAQPAPHVATKVARRAGRDGGHHARRRPAGVRHGDACDRMSPSSPRARSRTARSWCSTTRPATCWPTSAAPATCRARRRSTARRRRGRRARRSSPSSMRAPSTCACSPRLRSSTTARSPSRRRAAPTCRRTTTATSAAR